MSDDAAAEEFLEAVRILTMQKVRAEMALADAWDEGYEAAAADRLGLAGPEEATNPYPRPASPKEQT